jgi:single-stranded DNA-binding protein|tara:strand:+ start:2439 stop:2759 length:321 start_codon:yes stop_codon:yes gene_type:complete
MNFSNFLIRITSKPERSFFNEDIVYTEFIGKFYQFRDNKYTLCKVSIWGDLAYDALRYYNVNDYLVVEGYLSSQKSTFEELNMNILVEISASKVYPYALKKKSISK